jgi:hypothetical protein
VQRHIADVEGRLNGAGRVLIRESGTEPLVRVMAEGEDEFADITAYSDTIDYRRGRQRVVDQQNQAGLLNFRMADNVASGNLNPLYSGSTFWSTNEGVPGLAPMRPVRLSRSGVYLFKGRVTSYTSSAPSASTHSAGAEPGGVARA